MVSDMRNTDIFAGKFTEGRSHIWLTHQERPYIEDTGDISHNVFICAEPR